MIYTPPEIKGSIENFKQYYREIAKMKCFEYEIYLDDELVYKEVSDFRASDKEVLASAIATGERLRKAELLKRELASVGDELYIKWSDEITGYGLAEGLTGFYSVFVRGKMYCVFATQDLSEAIAKLEKIKLRQQTDTRDYKRIVREMNF
jgi:nitrogen regulatory protein PII-like uncharacterized protein